MGDDVSLDRAFQDTPCEATSCGVVQSAAGTCAPSPAPTVTRDSLFGSDAAPKAQFTSFGALLGAAALLFAMSY